MRYFLSALFLLFSSCNQRLPIPEVFDDDKSVIEFIDFYQAGQEQFEEALQLQPSLEKVWHNNKHQLLLIMLIFMNEDNEREQVQQSGVFVMGGEYILTVAHGFDLDDSQLVEMKARTVSGKELPLEMVQMSYQQDGLSGQDWAILRPTVLHTGEGVLAPEKKSIGEVVLLLGYPGSMGLNSEGLVVRAYELGKEDIFPLGMICDRIILKPRTLVPLAGAIPIRGVSGAPIFDQNGGLIGIFSSVSRARLATGWEYIFSMSEVPWKTLDALSKN